jgi:hypothetical protein
LKIWAFIWALVTLFPCCDVAYANLATWGCGNNQTQALKNAPVPVTLVNQLAQW